MSTEHQYQTTEQVANRLVELCRQGKVLEAQQELFDANVTCIEAPYSNSPTVTGKQAAIEKGKQFAILIEEVHSAEISDPVVAGRWFSIAWEMDATMKGQGRQKMEEILVYHFENGKIVSEQHFF